MCSCSNPVVTEPVQTAAQAGYFYVRVLLTQGSGK